MIDKAATIKMTDKAAIEEIHDCVALSYSKMHDEDPTEPEASSLFLGESTERARDKRTHRVGVGVLCMCVTATRAIPQVECPPSWMLRLEWLALMVHSLANDTM